MKVVVIRKYDDTKINSIKLSGSIYIVNVWKSPYLASYSK